MKDLLLIVISMILSLIIGINIGFILGKSYGYHKLGAHLTNDQQHYELNGKIIE